MLARSFAVWLAILPLAIVNGVLREALLESGFGLLRGLPVRQVLAAYTFTDGNLWRLVLVTTLVAPAIAWRRI
ncbi:MAG: hypothetical protein HY854_04730 [Burkholderiales bacterium]|nr:hypothetical protein [Burkholderiales bacterium]